MNTCRLRLAGLCVFASLAVMGALVGCQARYPAYYPLSQYTEAELGLAPFKKVDTTALKNMMYRAFGGPAEPGLTENVIDADTILKVHKGSVLYRRHCIHCHGLAGGGDGPSAQFLFPRPRDFRRGIFKWKTTTTNSKPTHDDLKRVLIRGANGTSMPSFRLLKNDELDALVEYVKFLSQRGEVEFKVHQLMANDQEMIDDDTFAEQIENVLDSWNNPTVVKPKNAPVPYTPQSSAWQASVERGRSVFLSASAGCTKCHGRYGDSSGSEKQNLKDEWGFPITPRNLTLGLYAGGQRPIDLYCRVTQGIAGAKMPKVPNTIDEDQVWDLVNFLRALPNNSNLLQAQPPTMQLPTQETQKTSSSEKSAGTNKDG